MLSSLSSARRIAAGAVGASAVAGAMLFGATPAANAAPAPAPQSVGFAHVAPASPAGFGTPLPTRGGPGGFGGGHGGFGRGGHGGFGRGGYGGFGRGGFGRGGGWGHGGWGRGGGFGRGWGWGHHGWWR